MHDRRLPCMCILAALAVAGCGGSKVAPIDLARLPLREATAAELVTLINARADSIRAVRADLDLSFRRAPDAPAKECRGKLVALRDAGETSPSFYLKGYKRLVPTFFTLVSNGAEFWLHVPSENTVYTGPVDRDRAGSAPNGRAAQEPVPREAVGADTSSLDLEAADLARALFVEPIDTAMQVLLATEDGHYILSLSDIGVVRRRLRIERRLFSVVGETYYDRDGAEELVLLRSDFTLAAGVPYPLKAVIVKPGSGREIMLEIRELDFDPGGLGHEVFGFRPPRGATIERIE